MFFEWWVIWKFEGNFLQDIPQININKNIAFHIIFSLFNINLRYMTLWNVVHFVLCFHVMNKIWHKYIIYIS